MRKLYTIYSQSLVSNSVSVPAGPTYHFLLQDFFSFLFFITSYWFYPEIVSTVIVISVCTDDSSLCEYCYGQLCIARSVTTYHAVSDSPHRTLKEREFATYSLASTCIHTKGDGIDG